VVYRERVAGSFVLVYVCVEGPFGGAARNGDCGGC
jgi:hypothetical protein